MQLKYKVPMIAVLVAAVLLVNRQRSTAELSKPDKTYALTDEVAARISAAAPSKPVAKPQKTRKVLVYGRMQTHPESVVCCFHAMKQIAEKSRAFEVVCSGDPAVFLPKSLAQFDAIVMNNTHERYPMRPIDFDSLDGATKKKLQQRERVLKKSLVDFVKGGKGIVGIHGAVAGNVQWPEYLEMLNGSYGGHFSETVAVGPVIRDHTICKPLGGKTFKVYDELYMFKEPYDPDKVQILLALDLTEMKDPGKRPEKDYPVSWIRSYGDGRVFYCSLGHFASAYASPEVMEHYLAGIQWAMGDLGE
jgi:type 1 glutamine amidotransferase